LVTNEPALFYGNVRNTRLIDNLPEDCCVEVPVVVDRNGRRPWHVGKLPPELAAHCAPHVYVQELVARAALDGDRARVYRTVLLDRLAPSVLSISEIRAMVDELIAAHGGGAAVHLTSGNVTTAEYSGAVRAARSGEKGCNCSPHRGTILVDESSRKHVHCRRGIARE
jgi:hypothetical protein